MLEAISQGMHYMLMCIVSLDTLEPMYMVFQGVADLLERRALRFMLFM